jgi:hypothetical protein
MLIHPSCLFIRIIIFLSLIIITKTIWFTSLPQKLFLSGHVILKVYFRWSFSVLFNPSVMFCLFGVLAVELLYGCESLH